MGPKSKEEKIEAEIRRLSKLDGNKVCADCPEKMPNYVNLTFKTFVCTNCAGIHRSINYNGNPTKVKGISMSSFTMDEATELARGGNNSNNAIFMARYVSGRDQPLPTSSEREKMSTFIRQKYENKRWFNDGTNNNDWGNNNNNNSNPNSFSGSNNGGQYRDNSSFNQQQNYNNNKISFESSSFGNNKPLPPTTVKPAGLDLLDMAGGSSLMSPTSQHSKSFNPNMNTNTNNNNNNTNSFDTFSSTSNFDPFSSSFSSSFSGFENNGNSFSFNSSSTKPSFDQYGDSSNGNTTNSKSFDPFNNSSSSDQQPQQFSPNFDVFGSSGQQSSLTFDAFGNNSNNAQSSFDPFGNTPTQPVSNFGQPQPQNIINTIAPVAAVPEKIAPKPLTANFSAFDDLVISEPIPQSQQSAHLTQSNPYDHSKPSQNPSSNPFGATQSNNNMYAQQQFSQHIFPLPSQQQFQPHQPPPSFSMPQQQPQQNGFPMPQQQPQAFPFPQQPPGFPMPQQHQGFSMPQQQQQQHGGFPMPQQQQPQIPNIGYPMSQQQPQQNGFPMPQQQSQAFPFPQQLQGFPMPQQHQGFSMPQQQMQGDFGQHAQSFTNQQSNVVESSASDPFSAMTSMAFGNVSLPPPAPRPSFSNPPPSSNPIPIDNQTSNNFQFAEQQSNPYSMTTTVTSNNAQPASTTAAANPFDLF